MHAQLLLLSYTEQAFYCSWGWISGFGNVIQDSQLFLLVFLLQSVGKPIKDPVCCTASHSDQRWSVIPGLCGWKMCWKFYALFASDFVFPTEETSDFGHFCTHPESAGQFNEGPQKYPEIGHSFCLLWRYFYFYLQSFRCGLIPWATTSQKQSGSQGSREGCWGLQTPLAQRSKREALGLAFERAAQQILPTLSTGQDSCFRSGWRQIGLSIEILMTSMY